MSFHDLISKRYSVRAYQNTPVEEEKLAQILTAAQLAPTAANRQPFKLIVIHTAGRETELRKIYNRDWFVQAPIVICAVGTPKTAWTRFDQTQYLQTDAAIAMDHLILAATELGLGTCWIAAFDPEAARTVLGIPPQMVPLIFTPVGYPADQPKEKERKPLESLVRYENW